MALDTTGRAGSVALVEDGVVVREEAGDGSRTHGERLPGELAALGAPFSSVDVFAVASGPGSFTGLRIGIATMQGLALVHRRRRGTASPRSTPTRSWRAAGSRPARSSPAGSMRSAAKCSRRSTVSPRRRSSRPSASSSSRRRRWPIRLAPWRSGRAILFHPPRSPATAPSRYAGALPGTGDAGRLAAPVPIAGAIGCLAAVAASRGLAVPPGAVHALYVRRPDAELLPRPERTPLVPMASWIIEPLSSPSEIDDILAIEEASFTSPWTREMYLAELAQSRRLVLLPRENRRARGRRLLFVLARARGAAHQQPRRPAGASPGAHRRPSCCGACSRTARRAAPAAPRSKSGARTSRRRSCTRSSGLPSPACGASTTATRRRTPSCCGARVCRELARPRTLCYVPVIMQAYGPIRSSCPQGAKEAGHE